VVVHTQASYDPKAYIKTFIDLENRGHNAPTMIEFVENHRVDKEVLNDVCGAFDTCALTCRGITVGVYLVLACAGNA